MFFKLLLSLLLVTFSSTAHAMWYVSNPDGTLAFDSVETYDKVIKSHSTGDKETVTNLLKSEKLKILSPGTPVDIKAQVGTVYAVTLMNSSKLYVVVSTDISKTDTKSEIK